MSVQLKICSIALAGISQGLSSSLPNEKDGCIIIFFAKRKRWQHFIDLSALFTSS